jgi:hypothetical protein
MKSPPHGGWGKKGFSPTIRAAGGLRYKMGWGRKTKKGIDLKIG